MALPGAKDVPGYRTGRFDDRGSPLVIGAIAFYSSVISVDLDLVGGAFDVSACKASGVLSFEGAVIAGAGPVRLEAIVAVFFLR